MISRRALLSTGLPSRASASCAVSDVKTAKPASRKTASRKRNCVASSSMSRISGIRNSVQSKRRTIALWLGSREPEFQVPKHSADDYNGREPRVPRSASLHSPDPAYSRAAHTVHRHDGGFRSPGRWRKSPASHRVKSLLAWLLLPLCGHCHCGGTFL